MIKKLEGDEKIGATIIRRAIEEPLRMIVSNAGEEGAVVIGKIHESKEANYGYNAATNVYEDPGKGRRHRSDEGNADCTAGTRLRSLVDADH